MCDSCRQLWSESLQAAGCQCQWHWHCSGISLALWRSSVTVFTVCVGSTLVLTAAMATVPVLNPFAVALAAQVVRDTASASTAPPSILLPASTPSAATATGSVTPHRKVEIQDWSENRAVWTMRLGNIFNALLLCVASIATFFISSVTPAPSTFARYILSGYLFVLGILLLSVDLNIASLRRITRLNFGFLFTYMGRAVYILL